MSQCQVFVGLIFLCLLYFCCVCFVNLQGFSRLVLNSYVTIIDFVPQFCFYLWLSTLCVLTSRCTSSLFLKVLFLVCWFKFDFPDCSHLCLISPVSIHCPVVLLLPAGPMSLSCHSVSFLVLLVLLSIWIFGSIGFHASRSAFGFWLKGTFQSWWRNKQYHHSPSSSPACPSHRRRSMAPTQFYTEWGTEHAQNSTLRMPHHWRGGRTWEHIKKLDYTRQFK